MGFVKTLLGRLESGIQWSTNIVLNDFACVVGPEYVLFGASYEKASVNGKGVPVCDEEVEVIRHRPNGDTQFLSAPEGAVAKHEIKHLLCETRQCSRK